jgi:hypothetical protein
LTNGADITLTLDPQLPTVLAAAIAFGADMSRRTQADPDRVLQSL